MISAERVSQLLHYDEETGLLTWKVAQSRRVKVGHVAGCVKKRSPASGPSYRYVKIDGRTYAAHRIAWLFITGTMPSWEIDHIDGDGTNNRKNNLRDVRHVENCRNQKFRSTNKTGVMGVEWDAERHMWRATIKVNGRRRHIGRYDRFEDAVNARKAAVKQCGFHELHGSRK